MDDCVDLPEDETVNAHFRLAQGLANNYRAAVQWCKSTGKGSRAAISSKKWPAITRSSLERKLQSGPGPTAKDDRALLTLEEERQLITWVRAIATYTVTFAVFLRIATAICFNWCTAAQRRTAFRRVGIARVLCPDQINRTRFVHEETACAHEEQQRDLRSNTTPPGQAPQPKFDVQSPEGVTKGTRDYFKLKYEDATRVISNLKQAPITPRECRVLQLPAAVASPVARFVV